MPSAPSGKPVRRGGWLAFNRSTGLIYAAKGYKTTDFYCYDAMRDTWTSLAGMPHQTGNWPEKPPRKGSKGACDDANSVYVTQGNNSLGFWKYSIAEDTWTMLPDVPLGPHRKKVRGGTDMVYVVQESIGYVYLLKGYGTEFYRYNTRIHDWETLRDAPIGLKDKWHRGSWLVYDGDSLIYAHKAKYHELWTYDTRTTTWATSPRTGMPFIGMLGRKKKSKDGGSATWGMDNIYALKGGNTQEFWCYRPERDTWLERDTLPSLGSTGRRKRVKHGADIVYFGLSAVFALKGNKTLEMWLYFTDWMDAPSERPYQCGAATLKTDEDLRLTIAPNPVTGRQATVSYSLPRPGPVTLTVFDIMGRSVSTTRSPSHSVTGSLPLDLRGLSRGIYLLRLDTPGHSTTSKLVLP